MEQKKDTYRKHWLSTSLKKALEIIESGASSVITLTGARQTGKTTLALNEEPFRNWHYINLDDLDTLALAKREPELLLETSQETIVDEIQRVPELLLTIKKIVDSKRGKFLLTGSANLLLMKRVSETLAGRTLIFNSHPFALREWHLKPPGILLELLQNPSPRVFENLPESLPLEKSIEKVMLEGSMPATLKLERNHEIWWESYVKTYLERDLRDISSISNLADFHRFMEILSHMNSQILKETSIVQDLGSVSQATVHRWINLLEASHIILKVRPYLKSKISSIRKSPKVYFMDPALAFHLMGIPEERLTEKTWGALFENFVFLQITAVSSILNGKVYFWRTKSHPDREVDFVVETRKATIAIEAKNKDTVAVKDAQDLAFLLANSGAQIGLIVYRGKEVKQVLKNIFAVPVELL